MRSFTATAPDSKASRRVILDAMKPQDRSATRAALLGVLLALGTIALAVVIVVLDVPILVQIALGIVGGLSLICAGASLGYALAIIRVRDDDDDED